MADYHHTYRMTRRAALKTGVAAGAVLAGGAAVMGTTAAHPHPSDHEVIWGDDIDFLDGVVRTYATTGEGGSLSSLGVYMDARALETFDEDHLEAHLHFPEGVDTHEFTWLGFHYNQHGHPPPGIYTVPHFDFHFYMISEETVGSIVTEPATYDIPAAQIPSGYSRVPVVDTDGDGNPDAPLVEEDMGEHLADLSSPEFQEGGEFTHTMIYGAYDYTGDGIGRITFLEPMITNEFLRNLTETMVVDFGAPQEYADAGQYPTQYVMQPGIHGGVYVSLTGFEPFPGARG